MSTISSVSSTSSSSYSDTASRVPQKSLGREDFMQLLAVQFQMQDPMKPMEDTAFIAQTAQFTSLEQSANMVSELEHLRTEQQRVVANSYLGHRVTVDLGDGKSATGDVTAVDNTGDSPRIVVNGEAHALSAVLRVEPGIVSASATATQSSGA